MLLNGSLRLLRILVDLEPPLWTILVAIPEVHKRDGAPTACDGGRSNGLAASCLPLVDRGAGLRGE